METADLLILMESIYAIKLSSKLSSKVSYSDMSNIVNNIAVRRSVDNCNNDLT